MLQQDQSMTFWQTPEFSDWSSISVRAVPQIAPTESLVRSNYQIYHDENPDRNQVNLDPLELDLLDLDLQGTNRRA